MAPNAFSNHDDLVPQAFPMIAWKAEESKESLRKLTEYSVNETTRAINWYGNKRKHKRKGGQFLRVGAIVAGTLAALIPVLGQIFEKAKAQPGIAPGWATVAVAIAALSISLDKFWGFSDAWVRYMLAEQELSAALIAFQFDLQATELTWNKTDLPNEYAALIVVKCQRFLENVHDIVREETSGWVGNFRKAIDQVEATTRSLAITPHPNFGGVSIEITNKDQYDHWQVKINDGPATTVTGKTTASGNLVPGIYVISASVLDKGREISAEKAVLVSAGKISAVELTMK